MREMAQHIFWFVVLAASSFLCTALCDVYLTNGDIDITKTLYNCSLQMTDSRLVASMKSTEPVIVSAQFLLNSLISVNEIEGTVTLDFFFKLQWIDPRWVIPNLWFYLDQRIAVWNDPLFLFHRLVGSRSCHCPSRVHRRRSQSQSLAS
jgi:hypothetical protein